MSVRVCSQGMEFQICTFFFPQSLVTDLTLLISAPTHCSDPSQEWDGTIWGCSSEIAEFHPALV